VKYWFYILSLCLTANASFGAEEPVEITPPPVETSAPAPTTNEHLLTWDEALTAIVERSTSVQKQQATLGSTRARNVPTYLSLLPSLSLNLNHNQNRGYAEQTSTTTRSLVGTASLNIFRFGADIANIRAASLEEGAQVDLLNDALIKAETEAIKGLASAIKSSLELRIIKQLVDVQSTSLKIARERYRQGLLASQEADKVSIDLDNAIASLSDAEIRTTKANADLRALLGHTNIELEWPWKESLSRGLPVLEVSEKSLRQRPDWLAAEKRLEVAERKVSQSWGKMFPSLDLNASYGYEHRVTARNDGQYFGGTLTLTIPLFDRLTNISEYRAQIFGKDTAEASLEQIRRTARAEWEASKVALEISLQTAKSRDRTLVTSRNLYRDNLRRFYRGLASANDLIVDQNRLYNTELNAVAGWNSVHLNFSDWCHALGLRVAQCRPRPPTTESEPAEKSAAKDPESVR